MSKIVDINSAPSVQPQEQDPSINAFMIVLLSMLNNINAQQEGIESAIQKEQLLKLQFEQQKAVVDKEAKYLKDLVDQGAKVDPTDIQALQKNLFEIQAQMAVVQAEQTKLSFVQNKMVQCFKRDVDPAQSSIQADSVMFGGMLHSYLLTQRIK